MERSPDSDGSLLDSDEALERSREVLGSPLHEKSIFKSIQSNKLHRNRLHNSELIMIIHSRVKTSYLQPA